MIHFITIECIPKGWSYFMRIMPCEIEHSGKAPEILAKEELMKKFGYSANDLKVRNVAMVGGNCEDNGAVKGKIIMKMHNPMTLNEEFIELTPGEWIETLRFRDDDGELDWDSMGYWMGKSDEDLFWRIAEWRDEQWQKNKRFVSDEEFITEFLKYAENGIYIDAE